jgi:predicted aldo/keto reductase-like oxidoreductase
MMHTVSEIKMIQYKKSSNAFDFAQDKEAATRTQVIGFFTHDKCEVIEVL